MKIIAFNNFKEEIDLTQLGLETMKEALEHMRIKCGMEKIFYVRGWYNKEDHKILDFGSHHWFLKIVE